MRGQKHAFGRYRLRATRHQRERLYGTNDSGSSSSSADPGLTKSLFPPLFAFAPPLSDKSDLQASCCRPSNVYRIRHTSNPPGEKHTVGGTCPWQQGHILGSYHRPDRPTNRSLVRPMSVEESWRAKILLHQLLKEGNAPLHVAQLVALRHGTARHDMALLTWIVLSHQVHG